MFCMYYARIFNSKMNYGLFILLPSFSGNTGGYLSSACQEEHYLIKWYSIDNQIIELPTGGSALMRKGENILYFAKKEQCLAICRQLRTLFKIVDSLIFKRGSATSMKLSQDSPNTTDRKTLAFDTPAGKDRYVRMAAKILKNCIDSRYRHIFRIDPSSILLLDPLNNLKSNETNEPHNLFAAVLMRNQYLMRNEYLIRAAQILKKRIDSRYRHIFRIDPSSILLLDPLNSININETSEPHNLFAAVLMRNQYLMRKIRAAKILKNRINSKYRHSRNEYLIRAAQAIQKRIDARYRHIFRMDPSSSLLLDPLNSIKINETNEPHSLFAAVVMRNQPLIPILDDLYRCKYELNGSLLRVKAMIEFIHPKDGIIPEKIAPGRQGVNQVGVAIGRDIY